jgi:plastocyanin
LKVNKGLLSVSRRVGVLAAALLLAPMASSALYSPPAASSAAPESVVLMKDNKFVPERDTAVEGQSVSIAVGATVTWLNQDTESHNIAILEGPELNVSPEQKKGEKWSMTFNKPGRYRYYCEFHPNMIADIIVGGVNDTTAKDRDCSDVQGNRQIGTRQVPTVLEQEWCSCSTGLPHL